MFIQVTVMNLLEGAAGPRKAYSIQVIDTFGVVSVDSLAKILTIGGDTHEVRFGGAGRD